MRITKGQSIWIILVVLYGSIDAFHSNADQPKTRKLLYVGVDGCRFDSIQKAKTPNLDRLMENGSYTGQCRILGERYQKNDTISGPGWSTIYTGVWADKHGVNDNSFAGKNYSRYPHMFARFRREYPSARLASFVTWAPIHDHIVSNADVSRKFERDKNYPAADIDCKEAVVQELRDNDPTMVAFYIGQVDETGHKFGFHPTVPEYIAAIERADGLVGDALNAIHARPTRPNENWLVIVTSDHGGKGTGHGNGHHDPDVLNSFLIVSGESAKRGELQSPVELVDAARTAMEFLGAAPETVADFDGKVVGLQ